MGKGKIVAIMRGVEPENAVMVAGVLLEEGINSMEVSLSDEEKGLQCIRAIAEAFKDRIDIGAGTVINEAQVDKVIAAGARFVITPGWDKELVRYIMQKGLRVFPGVFSPGEIMAAINEKVEIMKLFPAGTLGTDYIKNLFGPFPKLKLMAVGGVNKSNIKAFYAAGCSFFGIGSDLIPRGAGERDLEYIRKSAQEYMSILKE